MADYLPVFTSAAGEREVRRAYAAVLAQWHTPYTEVEVATSFGQTHVIASGPEDGPPVALLHAFFATATAWYRNAEALSRQYRTYAVDVLGEANPSRPTRPMKSLDDCRQWFTELLDGLGIDQLYLAGNSFGGFTAAYYAMHLPERVRKLVLIGPAATFRAMRPFYLHMFIPKALALFFPWLPGQARLRRHSLEWYRAGLPRDEAWDTLFELVLQHGSGTNQVFPRVYTAAELAQIKAPTLLILGAQERIYPPEAARQAARRLMPGVQVQIIPQAHHITALAQPERVNAALLHFFEADDGAAPLPAGALVGQV